MNAYESSKKARHIASVVYLTIMAVIMTGTYISEQNKEAARKEALASQESSATPAGAAGAAESH